MSKFRTISLLACGTLVLAGCNASLTEKAMEGAMDNQADVEMNTDGTVDVTTDEGSMKAGSQEVPANWPTDVAVYEGATVAYSANVNPADGKPGSALMLQTTATPAEVSEFYTASLEKEGWKVEGSMQAGSTTVIGASKDGRMLSISIASGADGQTAITLAVSQK